jgi:hypothetical protein
MDFQSAMETFAEAWVAANAGAQVSTYLIYFQKNTCPRQKAEEEIFLSKDLPMSPIDRLIVMNKSLRKKN